MLFDLIIIGGGPIGLACALEAKRKALNYLLIEKGCLVNSIYNYPTNMTFFSTSERLEIGEIPFVSMNAKPKKEEALEYYRRVAISNNIDIHLFEEVILVTGSKNNFNVETSKGFYKASNIIIATGFYDIPQLLNIPGESLPKVTHYYKDPHLYAFQNVVIVGANNSAVDAALETYRKGANVTMIVREKEIGQRVKYWVRPDIINRINEGTIKAYFNANLIEIKQNSVVINNSENILEIENDWVIAATGYQPNLLFLEGIGIKLSNDELQKPKYDNHTHETNIKGIFLAGVICGGKNTHSLFIENSREHAYKIINYITA